MIANMKTLTIAAVCVAALASQANAKPAYSAKIPNGEAMGKALGHSGDDYTAFGTMFSKAGLSWSAVCKEAWPGASGVTVGAALGDPCCKWSGSGAAEVTLSAPNASAKACAAAATPAAAPAATTAAPAATTAAPGAAATVATVKPAGPATTPAPAANATPKVTPASTTPSGGAKTPLAPTIPGGLLCE